MIVDFRLIWRGQIVHFILLQILSPGVWTHWISNEIERMNKEEGDRNLQKKIRMIAQYKRRLYHPFTF